MSVATAEMDRPVVLIVDDQPAGLDVYAKIFAPTFNTLTVSTKTAAVREIMSSPAVDLVFTDVNLEENTPDQSGVDLAAEIKKERSGLPIVGYSAIFDKDKLVEGYKDVFDETMPKNEFDPDKIDANIARYHDMAVRYRKQRTSQAERELQRLKAKFGIPEKDIALLRDLLPGRVFSNDMEPDELEDVDSLLRRLGYGLKIIGPGASRQTVDGAVRSILDPIPFWVKKESDCYIAELYGHPTIYAAGQTVDDAVGEALVFMDALFRDYSEVPPADPSAPETRKLWAFLTRVFRGAEDAAQNA